MENKKIDTGRKPIELILVLGLVILFVFTQTGSFHVFGPLCLFIVGSVLADTYILKRKLSRLTALEPQSMEMTMNQDLVVRYAIRGGFRRNVFRVELFSPTNNETPHYLTLVTTKVACREYQRILSKTEKVLVYGLHEKSGPVLMKTTANEWLWSKGTDRR
jgi:hypothetical protein